MKQLQREPPEDLKVTLQDGKRKQEKVETADLDYFFKGLVRENKAEGTERWLILGQERFANMVDR